MPGRVPDVWKWERGDDYPFPLRQDSQVSLTGGPLFAFTFRMQAILTRLSDFSSPRRDRLRTSTQFAGAAQRRGLSEDQARSYYDLLRSRLRLVIVMRAIALVSLFFCLLRAPPLAGVGS